MNRKKILALAIILLLIGCSLFWLFRDDPSVKNSNTGKTLRDRAIGLVVRQDASLIRKTVSQQAQNAGQLWSLSQPKASQQEFVIDANYEQGESLKKLTGYTKESLRDSVVANINIQLPRQYPQYKELTQRNLTVNGFDANETIFEYVTSGVKVKQRLLLLFKNSDTAVYMRGQAKADEYKEINSRYFEPIFSDAKFE